MVISNNTPYFDLRHQNNQLTYEGKNMTIPPNLACPSFMSASLGNGDDTPLAIDIFDTVTSNGFTNGMVVYQRVGWNGTSVGSNSHRETIRARTEVSNTSAGSMQVGVMGEASINAGSSGCAFGMNAVAQVLSGAQSNAEAVASEVNTDLRQNATRKVGLQVIDVNTSTGVGTYLDAGVYVGRQAGAAGFKYGMQIDHAWNGAININVAGGAGGIKFQGGPGGLIRSDTTTGGHRVIFVDGQTVVQSSKTGLNIFAIGESDVIFPIGGVLKRFIARGDGLVGWVNA